MSNAHVGRGTNAPDMYSNGILKRNTNYSFEKAADRSLNLLVHVSRRNIRMRCSRSILEFLPLLAKPTTPRGSEDNSYTDAETCEV